MANKPITANDLNPDDFGAQGGTDKVGAGIKYNINNLSYPLAVAGDDDLQHYVGFFINIRGKSKWKNSYKTVQITGIEENRMDPKQADTAQRVGGTALGVAIEGKLGASVAGTYLGNLKKASTTAKVIGVTAGAVAGATIGAIGANAFDADTTYRIDSAIMLAVNEKPSVKYDVNYKGQDMGGLSGFLAGGSSAIDSTAGDASKEVARSLLLNMAEIPSGIAQALGSDFDFKALASVGTGTVQNPFREQIFQSVDNRTFQFDYKFLPRSAAEAASVENIIKMFKFHMHPELSAGGLFYIYPSQFNIVYYYKGKINPHVHKISTCVLNSLNVDYGGQQFGSFNDGMPTEINMRLNFVELETLTKERIALGY